jgi:hypothetical protein
MAIPVNPLQNINNCWLLDMKMILENGLLTVNPFTKLITALRTVDDDNKVVLKRVYVV